MKRSRLPKKPKVIYVGVIAYTKDKKTGLWKPNPRYDR